MGFFGNVLKGVGSAATGFLTGGPAGAVIGGVGGLLSSGSQAGGYDRAGRAAAGRANQGFNWLNRSVIGREYLPAGGQATTQMRDLLGLGDDPAAAQAAFEAWQNSTGFQNRLEQGSNAITGSRAARGALGSGATLKALQRRGQELGTESFGNYFAQLMGLSNQGLSAGQLIGNAATAGGTAGAGYGFQGDVGAADIRRGGIDDLIGGLGGAYESWRAGRQPPSPIGGGGAAPGSYGPLQESGILRQPLNFLRTIR